MVEKCTSGDKGLCQAQGERLTLERGHLSFRTGGKEKRVGANRRGFTFGGQVAEVHS